jgi:hypothetical protein
MNQSRHARFLLIAVLMILFFTYPLLSAANKQSMIMGIPLLYLYIGVVWVAGIIALYLTVNFTRRK